MNLTRLALVIHFIAVAVTQSAWISRSLSLSLTARPRDALKLRTISQSTLPLSEDEMFRHRQHDFFNVLVHNASATACNATNVAKRNIDNVDALGVDKYNLQLTLESNECS